MRKLWKSDEPFSFHGRYFSSDFFFLYTKPRTQIPIYFSAVGKKSAYYAGQSADKLVTVCPRNNIARLNNIIFPAYRKGMMEAKRKTGGLVILISFTFSSPSYMMKNEWRTLGSMRKDSWSIKVSYCCRT